MPPDGTYRRKVFWENHFFFNHVKSPQEIKIHGCNVLMQDAYYWQIDAEIKIQTTHFLSSDGLMAS